MTLFVTIYLLALCCYFHTRTSGNRLHRTVNKYIMAVMYLGLAATAFLRKYEIASFQTILMAALVFAWLGDIFLVFDFKRGGYFFFAGNICFIIYECAVMIRHGYGLHDLVRPFLAAAILLSGFILGCQYFPKTFRLGKMRWPMTLYLSSILTHGCTGLAMAFLMKGTPFVMMGTGSFLFMISDMILTSYRYIFGENKWLIRANSLTYFTGILLIVLSTV